MNNRKYAEDLVGELKRSHYDTQRGLLDKNYQTNWENLQNQFKNLTEDLEKRQALANRDFANGLVNVSDRSYDRLSNGLNNMTMKGLTASGLNNIVQQADTEQKGKEVANLLESLGDVNVKTSKGLAKGTSSMSKEASNLNKGLGEALGDVGAADTAAQMKYNAGVAGIAGSKDARDAQKQLEAMRDAARARAEKARASSGKGREEINKKIEEAYRRQAITNLLRNIDDEGNDLGMDAQQRANALRILLDVNNSEDVVKMFDENANFTANQKALKDELKGLEGKLDLKNKFNTNPGVNAIRPGNLQMQGDFQNNFNLKNPMEIDYFNRSNSTPVAGLNSQNNLNSELEKIKSRINEINSQTNLRDLSYQDLASLLYGNR